MLNEICGYLRNYFDKDRVFATFTISNDNIVADSGSLPILDGQYIRIIGSVFNDGIYQYPIKSGTLTDETFKGAIWLLAIPKDIIDLSKEITAWIGQYGTADSHAMSPFNSESFGGYSYSKSSAASADGASAGDWKSAFASRLTRYRKV